MKDIDRLHVKLIKLSNILEASILSDQYDAVTRVGVLPENWLLKLYPVRSSVINNLPIATSAECSCLVGDGPYTTWPCRTSTSRDTLASCSFPHHVQGRTADVSGPHEPMSGVYQRSRDISQLQPITVPTPLFWWHKLHHTKDKNEVRRTSHLELSPQKCPFCYQQTLFWASSEDSLF